MCKELANLKPDSSCDELEPGPSGDTGAAVPTGVDINRLRPGNHWPAELPSKEGQKRKPQKACVAGWQRGVQCAKNWTASSLWLQCQQCQKPLCTYPCFRMFHTMHDFTKWHLQTNWTSHVTAFGVLSHSLEQRSIFPSLTSLFFILQWFECFFDNFDMFPCHFEHSCKFCALPCIILHCLCVIRTRTLFYCILVV